jgi:diguanylate cyclase (GGDEF)-like protein
LNRKLFKIFIILTISIGNHYGNTSDTYDKVFKTEKEKIRQLLQVAKENTTNNLAKAINYANKAYSLATENNLSEEVGKALLAKGAAYYYASKLDQSLKNYNEALQVGKIINNNDILGSAFNGKAIVAMKKGDMNSALEMFKKANKLLKKTTDLSKKAAVLNNMALIYYSKGKYTKALEYMLSAKDIYEQINNSKGKAVTLVSIGNVYNLLNDYDQGEKYFKEALKLNDKNKDLNLQTACFVNLGLISLKKQKNIEAEKYLNKAIALTKKTKNKDYKAVCLNNLGDVKVQEKKYKEALLYYKSALRVFKDLQLEPRYSFCYLNLGKTYLKMNKINSAKKALLKGYYLSKKYSQKNYTQDCCKALTALYEKTGNYKKALQHCNEFIKLKDELLSAKKINAIKAINQKAEAEKKASEIALLKKDREINRLKMKRQQLQIYQILGFLILVLMVLGMLLKKYFFRVKTTAQLEKAYKKMESLAKYDSLTNLHNRHSAMERVEIEMVRMGRTWKPFGIMILDIDNFKLINDTYGHLAGDEVLKNISKILKTGVRKQDIVSRWGGEEFFIMLPDTDLEGTAYLAEKIRLTIEQTPFIYQDKSILLTVTIGVAIYDTPAPFNLILSKADKALYFGKEQGKNKVVVAKDNNGDIVFHIYRNT